MLSSILRWSILATLVLGGSLVALADEPSYSSPAALAVDSSGRHVYVADETGSRLIHVDTTQGDVRRRIPLPARPTGIALEPRKNRLYVTTAGTSGQVLVVDLERAEVAEVCRAGHTPMAPVLSEDGSILYVCNRFEDSLSVIDLGSGVEVKRIELRREPVAACLAAGGKLLAVANHQTYDPATRSDVSCSVSLVDTERREVVTHVRLPRGSVGLRGISSSPDGRFVFVTHILARNHVPATQLARGWIMTSAVSLVDVEEGRVHATVILDDVERGAADPWGVAVTADGRRLCIALAGVHEVAVIDLPGMLERLASLERQEATATVPAGHGETTYRTPYTRFGFLDGLKRRIPLRGRGPRSLAMHDGKLLVATYFSGRLETLDLDDLDSMPGSVSLDRERTTTEFQRGAALFHDASVAFQGWQSCSSCHPDGRSDGLNWDLTNDGIGNTKNAKSLLFADSTRPLTLAGIFDTLEECVRFEIRTILFAERPHADAAAIADYVRSLEPVPSPRLVDGRLSEAAERGKAVFEKAGCARCHAGEYYTSGEARNVGTAVPGDHRKSFDVPSLREVWRTAPYLHDGRSRTVREAITTHNPDDRHGQTSKLPEKDVADLVEFVMSL
ncbi:MAG: c-type cytochrome [Planctomycetota bacterium]|nr:c-type cytochrome [Planctomycetota bacterium]